MRKLLILEMFLLAAVTGYAQNVDHFEVGPYEVDYRGEGDFKYRLKKDIDLYRYYSLQKDTVIQNVDNIGVSVNNGIQVSLSLMMPRYTPNSCSNVFGIDGQWKQRITNGVYFSGGLLLAMSFCEYGNYWKEENENLFEVGVPLSIEFADINNKHASLYAGIGITPTFYGAAKEITAIDGKTVGGKSGLFIAPRIDIGGYIPVGNILIRLGGFLQYNINCSKDDNDNNVFKDRIGRCFLGANIGLVL